ncbi:MAG: MalY/PatB family protein [Bacilli bacterium]
MKYNFDEIISRKNTNSVKYDVLDNELPMWIADMDFKVCPNVIQAIQKRLDNGILGYSTIPPSFYETISSFYKRRHNVEIPCEDIIFVTGVVPSISSMVRRLTHPNEYVILLTPTYNIFFNSIINNGARPLESCLVYKDDRYEINFDDLEEKMKNTQSTLMILCNPSNPTGTIFSKEELSRIAMLAYKYNIKIISDEIHCELVDPGYEYVPFYSVSEIAKDISITCISPSKAFNIAGLQGAAIICHNQFLFNQINRGFNNDEIAEPNAFVIQAIESCYSECDDYLDQLREYIKNNKEYAYNFIEKEMNDIKVVHSHATYLLWIDISSLTNNSIEFTSFLREKTGLFVSQGKEYHGDGYCHIRLNIACPKQVVIDGLNRLKEGVQLFKKEKNH